MKEKPLPAMVQAYLNSGALSRRMDFAADKQKRFDSARETLFHYMSPTERHMARTLEDQLNAQQNEQDIRNR